MEWCEGVGGGAPSPGNELVKRIKGVKHLYVGLHYRLVGVHLNWVDHHRCTAECRSPDPRQMLYDRIR